MKKLYKIIQIQNDLGEIRYVPKWRYWFTPWFRFEDSMGCFTYAFKIKEKAENFIKQDIEMKKHRKWKTIG